MTENAHIETDRAHVPGAPNGGAPRQPFGGKRRLYNAVKVKFSSSFIKHVYDAQLLELKQGDQVIVETSKGPALAEVASFVHRKLVPSGSLKRVFRVANREDERRAAQNQSKEEEAFRYSLVKIRERRLPMKLIQVQYMHDGSKAIFYFSADGRIDFRELVKDLANRFRTRIEMRQIGVRDGARMVGGIGSCGRELCCSTFLEQFAPVSIRMAKDQGLTLNPKKVSGMCGRLMCCLVYEQQIYRKTRRRLPRAGKPVKTVMGLGMIRDVDVIRERVAVYLEDEGHMESFPVREVVVLTPQEVEEYRNPQRPPERNNEAVDPDKRLKDALAEANQGEDEYLWDERASNEGNKGSGGGGQNRRGRRRGRRSGTPKPSGPSSGNTNAKSGSGDGDKRPRRRGRGPGGPRKGSQAPKAPQDAAGKQPPSDKGAKAQSSEKPGDGSRTKRRRRRRKRSGGAGEGGSEPSGSTGTQGE